MAGRVGRSLKVSEEGKEKAQKALTDRCLTQKELGKELGFSRETLSKFFRGLSVDRQYFVKICEELRLEWDEIVAKPASQAVQRNKQQDSALDIDVLVQEVREKRHEKIQHQCGIMRMLDISQPVALADIYTDVNILEQITSQQWRDIPDLLKDFNPESDDFDRLGHGKRLQRVPGLDAVSRYSKLMLLGKPGAGKTTFLQWVAIKCDLGEFQSDRVPIFIRLKHFADDSRRDDSEFRLLNHISEEFVSCEIPNKSVIETILSQGKALILLDGLDEVSEQDDEVVRQIRRFADKYFKNQFIITCRIAAQKYRFQGFTDVEVADFNSEQVEAFTKKWFLAVAKNDGKEGEGTARRFIDKLNLLENQQIKELVVTPILLNLTCLVFQTKGEFPSKRFKLYDQGLDILLIKWDEEKGIKRDEASRNLSLGHKNDLLSQVAAITFERSHYFFEKDEVERYIADYLLTLPNTQTDQANLQQNSKAVLKSIVQHGLLVERAREIYSFSHLTFQEYLCAKAFVNNFCSETLGKLTSHINEPRWHEVFLLTSNMLKNADNIVLSIKERLDENQATNKAIDNLMTWIYNKCDSIDAPLKPAALRAEGFSFELEYTYLFNSAMEVIQKNLSFDLSELLSLHQIFMNEKSLLTGSGSMLIHPKIARVPIHWFNSIFDSPATRRLRKVLNKFNHKFILITSLKDWLQMLSWWQHNGQDWIEDLRCVTMEFGNNTNSLQLSQKKYELLYQYYNANKLLMECLNISEVSPEVRQEIEDTLLLPIAELEKRQQRILERI